MLYYLFFDILRNVHPSMSWMRVFEYEIFRAAVATLTAMLISLVLGPIFIERLKRFQISQYIREEGPKSHQKKQGTPTMGGILILASVVGATICWMDLKNANVWLAIFSILAFGAIGFADDYLKVAKKNNLGLQGRYKLIFQLLNCLIIIGVLYLTGYEPKLSVPFIKTFTPTLWWPIYGFFIWMIITGFSNAVNLTDGLDGLAISITFVTVSTLTVFTYLTGNLGHATFLGLIHNPAAAEVTIFCAALAGASLGFLWFNSPPAEMFMGDVGSLALGGSIATVAVIIKQEFLLGLMGGVFIIEMLSVMLQVASYKTTGKRIFKMSPIHHHFELLGWKETKIVFRFLIVAIFFALLSLATLKLR